MKQIVSYLMLAGVCLLGGIPASAQDRLLGGDISLLPSYEQQATVYKTSGGKTIKHLLPFFREQGWNAMRVRLFVNPENAPQNNKDEGVCQDLDYVIALSKRIKEAGFQLMLDFHYSDTWADPGKQFTPRQWESATPTALHDSLYHYTRRALQAMNAAGCTPDLIQIGNEITFGMLWPTAKVDPYKPQGWPLLCSLLNSAARACRETCPQARLIIHTEHAGEPQATMNFYDYLKMYGVDYDIIGLSYYPMWHKRLPVLRETLQRLALWYPDKPVMIVEAAFYYSHENDRWEKDPQAYSEYYPISPDGQRQFTEQLVAELKQHHNVTGLFWWFPEENCYHNQLIKSWINRGLFDNRTGRALPALHALQSFLTE